EPVRREFRGGGGNSGRPHCLLEGDPLDVALGHGDSAVESGDDGLGDGGDDVVDGDLPAEFAGERRDSGVADAARDDRVERVESRIAVECEAVHGDTTLHPDADRSDLAFGEPVPVTQLGGKPDTGASFHAAAVQAHVGTNADQALFDATHVADDVDRLGELDDGVADELPGAVPGDLAAA